MTDSLREYTAEDVFAQALRFELSAKVLKEKAMPALNKTSIVATTKVLASTAVSICSERTYSAFRSRLPRPRQSQCRLRRRPHMSSLERRRPTKTLSQGIYGEVKRGLGNHASFHAGANNLR
jgi:hypothetical protein